MRSSRGLATRRRLQSALVDQLLANDARTVEAVSANLGNILECQVVVLSQRLQPNSYVSGCALRSDEEGVAVIILPATACVDRMMYVLGHEAWHLIRGDLVTLECDRTTEAECERFARRLVAKIKRLSNRDVLIKRPVATRMLASAWGGG